jgi:hypothetical protein
VKLSAPLEAATTRTPEEAALHRLRMLGLGIFAAAAVVDALQGPFTRWRAFRHRIVTDLSPLDAPGTTIVAVVADLLSATDGSTPARTRR